MLQTAARIYRNAYTGLPGTVWWLALAILINRSGTMVIPFLSVYLVNKGYQLTEAGMVLSLFGFGGFLGGYAGGWLSDRVGFYPVQLLSLLLTGLLFFGLGQVQELGQIALFVFLISLVGEAFRPANSAAIAAYSTDANRTRCFSLNRLAVNLGWSIGPALGGLLSAKNFSLLFWADGGTCLLAAGIMYLFLSPRKRDLPLPEAPGSGELPVRSPYRDAVFLKGMACTLVVGACFFQLFNVAAVFFEEKVHLSRGTIGWVLGLNGLIIALVEMVLVHSLEGKKNKHLFVLTGSFLVGLAYLILTLQGGLSMVLASVVVITFGEMMLFPYLNTFWVSRSRPSNRGTYAALFSMTFALGQMLAPATSSLVAQRFGFPVLWTMNFILCIAAGIGFLQLKKYFNVHE